MIPFQLVKKESELEIIDLETVIEKIDVGLL